MRNLHQRLHLLGRVGDRPRQGSAKLSALTFDKYAWMPDGYPTKVREFLPKKGQLIKMNRFAQNVAITAGLMTMLAVPGPARGDQAQGRPAPSHTPGSSSQAKPPSLEDFFSGLDYSDEEKASIDKVKQDMDAKKAVVAKSDKLDGSQKDAMITGYTRLEYAQIFKLLTPAQQKLVRKRMDAAKAANKPAQKPGVPPAPRN